MANACICVVETCRCGANRSRPWRRVKTTPSLRSMLASTSAYCASMRCDGCSAQKSATLPGGKQIPNPCARRVSANASMRWRKTAAMHPRPQSNIQVSAASAIASRMPWQTPSASKRRRPEIGETVRSQQPFVADRNDKVRAQGCNIQRQRAETSTQIKHQARAARMGGSGNRLQIQQRAVGPVRVRQRQHENRPISIERTALGNGCPFIQLQYGKVRKCLE